MLIAGVVCVGLATVLVELRAKHDRFSLPGSEATDLASHLPSADLKRRAGVTPRDRLQTGLPLLFSADIKCRPCQNWECMRDSAGTSDQDPSDYLGRSAQHCDARPKRITIL